MATLSRPDAPPPAARPVITLFRACELCAHSTTQGGRLMCNSPAVCLNGRPEVLDAARAPCGGCGPNARHLDMPGWR